MSTGGINSGSGNGLRLWPEPEDARAVSGRSGGSASVATTDADRFANNETSQTSSSQALRLAPLAIQEADFAANGLVAFKDWAISHQDSQVEGPSGSERLVGVPSVSLDEVKKTFIAQLSSLLPELQSSEQPTRQDLQREATINKQWQSLVAFLSFYGDEGINQASSETNLLDQEIPLTWVISYFALYALGTDQLSVQQLVQNYETFVQFPEAFIHDIVWAPALQNSQTQINSNQVGLSPNPARAELRQATNSHVSQLFQEQTSDFTPQIIQGARALASLTNNPSQHLVSPRVELTNEELRTLSAALASTTVEPSGVVLNQAFDIITNLGALIDYDGPVAYQQVVAAFGSPEEGLAKTLLDDFTNLFLGDIDSNQTVNKDHLVAYVAFIQAARLASAPNQVAYVGQLDLPEVHQIEWPAVLGDVVAGFENRVLRKEDGRVGVPAGMRALRTVRRDLDNGLIESDFIKRGVLFLLANSFIYKTRNSARFEQKFTSFVDRQSQPITADLGDPIARTTAVFSGLMMQLGGVAVPPNAVGRSGPVSVVNGSREAGDFSTAGDALSLAAAGLEAANSIFMLASTSQGQSDEPTVGTGVPLAEQLLGLLQGVAGPKFYAEASISVMQDLIRRGVPSELGFQIGNAVVAALFKVTGQIGGLSEYEVPVSQQQVTGYRNDWITDINNSDAYTEEEKQAFVGWIEQLPVAILVNMMGDQTAADAGAAWEAQCLEEGASDALYCNSPDVNPNKALASIISQGGVGFNQDGDGLSAIASALEVLGIGAQVTQEQTAQILLYYTLDELLKDAGVPDEKRTSQLLATLTAVHAATFITTQAVRNSNIQNQIPEGFPNFNVAPTEEEIAAFLSGFGAIAATAAIQRVLAIDETQELDSVAWVDRVRESSGDLFENPALRQRLDQTPRFSMPTDEQWQSLFSRQIASLPSQVAISGALTTLAPHAVAAWGSFTEGRPGLVELERDDMNDIISIAAPVAVEGIRLFNDVNSLATSFGILERAVMDPEVSDRDVLLAILNFGLNCIRGVVSDVSLLAAHNEDLDEANSLLNYLGAIGITPQEAIDFGLVTPRPGGEVVGLTLAARNILRLGAIVVGALLPALVKNGVFRNPDRPFTQHRAAANFDAFRQSLDFYVTTPQVVTTEGQDLALEAGLHFDVAAFIRNIEEARTQTPPISD